MRLQRAIREALIEGPATVDELHKRLGSRRESIWKALAIMQRKGVVTQPICGRYAVTEVPLVHGESRHAKPASSERPPNINSLAAMLAQL